MMLAATHSGSANPKRRPPYERSRKRQSISSSLGSDQFSLDTLRFSSSALHGRDHEASLLRSAYKRIQLGRVATGIVGKEETKGVEILTVPEKGGNKATSQEVVLISGRSGTGKSHLVRLLGAEIQASGNTLFAEGKFDVIRRAEPLAAINTALDRSCELILSLDGSKLAAIRSAVRDAVGFECSVLEYAIPTFSELLGAQQKMKDTIPGNSTVINENPTKIQHQLIILITRFVRAVCTHIPFVLFADDLQWADTTSLKLLRALVTDQENSGLLLIGCYRDDEVSEISHPLNDFLKALHENQSSASVHVTSVELCNLGIEAVNELVAGALSSSLSETIGLATIACKKTHGNIYFVRQFLEALHDEGLLVFSLGKLGWTWDEQQILSSMSVTSNVADLLIQKMRNNLQEEVQEILQVASCLGSSFDSNVLVLIWETVRKKTKNTLETSHYGSSKELFWNGDKPIGLVRYEEVQEFLGVCVREGFFEKDGKSLYRFVHDQVQQAAYSLIPECDVELMRWKIGNALLDGLAGAYLDSHLYVIADLLNSSMNSGESEKLAKLNLMAGQKALKLCAFSSSVAYLEKGIRFLGSDIWKGDSTLGLKLFISAAEAEYCNGCAQKSKYYVDQVLIQKKISTLDKIPAYFIWIRSMCHLQNKSLEGINVALHVLKLLGVRFPTANKAFIIASLAKTKACLRGISVSDLSGLPLMQDKKKIQAMQLMDEVVESAFLVKPDLLPLVVCKMVQWSVRSGVCKSSASAFACYGMILCSMGDFQGGNKIGKEAMALLKRLKAKDLEAKVRFICSAFLSHLVLPYHIVHKQLMENYDIGMQTGMITWAMFSVRAYCGNALHTSRCLSSVDSDAVFYGQQMIRYGLGGVLIFLMPVRQFALNMMGCSTNPVVLTGDAMNQDEFMKMCKANKSYAVLTFMFCYQLWLAFYFKDYHLAQKLLRKTKNTNELLRSAVQTWRNVLFEGLTAFSLAWLANKKKWKMKAKQSMRKVRDSVGKGNVNLVHILLLFEAELASLNGENGIAKRKYEEAVATAARFGITPDRAIAAERAGEFFLRVGDEYWAFHNLRLAQDLYISWGAKQKAISLYEEHGDRLCLPK